MNSPIRFWKTIPGANPSTTARLQGRGSVRGGFCLSIIGIFAALLLCATELQAGERFSREVLIDRERPRERRWEIALETSALFGVRNPNNYVIAPQLLSIAWQPFSQWQIGPVRIKGQILASFLGEAILHGPESYFIGGALRARLIFPLGTSRWSLYADGGGGMGAVDSDDTPLGQGEDFAFCLLASGGVRFSISDSWSVWAGFLWQHLSNADLSEPRRRNTGLDSLGPVAGASYAF
ncbi:MAG TPA: acyloxyacyl hydrolase [Terrimicrobiaceae bacterium]